LAGNSEDDHPIPIDETTKVVGELPEVNVLGDVDTRTKKVYTGNYVAVAAHWHRPL
jgi:hypothetical protein